jgi:voltage-gated potassium channel
MVPLLLAARELARALAAVWRDPETKALPVVAGALVLTGTLFYWRFEDWTIIEALYFCVVTLTTVGYGDLSPTTAGNEDLHDRLIRGHRHRDPPAEDEPQ